MDSGVVGYAGVDFSPEIRAPRLRFKKEKMGLAPAVRRPEAGQGYRCSSDIRNILFCYYFHPSIDLFIRFAGIGN